MLKVVYTPGCWDLLHVGHVAFLQAAAKLGDRLIVGVAACRVVKMDKGQYPVISGHDRVRMVAALRCVDGAGVYNELDFLPHLNLHRPEILAVGEEWGGKTRHVAAEEWMREHGGQVVRIPRTCGVSSSSIIEHIIAFREGR